jgi:hypothetical protein
MKNTLSALLLLPLTGCFTSWVVIQASDSAKILDEGVHESKVPVGGVREELRVWMPFAVQHDPPPPSPTGGPGIGVGAAQPFALGCQVTQRGQDTVYHAAFRYGNTWKRAAVVMFAAEAIAAALIYIDDRDSAGNQVTAAVFAADAIGTGLLAFAPRKEIYRTEQRPDDTLVREDCPSGLALEVGGKAFPVDAAGRLGTLGDTAVDEWMSRPGAPMDVTLAGQRVELPVGADARCTWNQEHHLAVGGVAPACAQYRYKADVAVTISVALGTLTQAN